MRVVIVGLGVQGHKRLIVAGADVVATVDPCNRKAQYSLIEQVPLDSFEAALVCTPDHEKLKIIEYLLTNGKHVLVEKPLLAASDEQLYRMEDLACAAGVACYTAYNHRFEPHVVRLKALLDSGGLGNIYLTRLFYGNGTARDVRHSSWRDQGLGVLPDLGSHVLDLALFFFGEQIGPFEAWSYNRFENRSFDHVLFGSTGRPVLEMEVTLLSWRNTFSVDVFGELGTAHIHCLCKWGPSVFTTRQRVLPSGKPNEERHTLECSDPTWADEYRYFKQLCKERRTNLKSDVWISSALTSLERQIIA